MASGNKFEDLLSELVDSEDVSEEAANRIKEASAGSPLRKERDEAIRERDELRQQIAKSRDEALEAQLAKHELKLNPKFLNLPDDLDVKDDKAFKDWLIQAGAIEDKESEAIDAELDQHQKVASAAATGATARTTAAITPEIAADWAPDKWMRFEKEHPEAAERLLRGQEVTGIAF